MNKSFVMAFDLGTSSLKGVLMDEEANIISSAIKKVLPYYPEFGWAESDPDIWWAASCAISRELLHESSVSPELIRGVAFDAPAYGVIPMNLNKGKIYNDIIWLDNRASTEADEMNNMLGGAESMNRPFTGKDALPKLPWIRKNRKDIWDEMDVFLDDVGYLVYCATGRYVSPIQSASCVNVDLTTGDWDWKLIDRFELPHSLFPEIVDASDVVDNLTPYAAKQMGLTTNVQVVGGMTDLQAIELGCGCVNEGDGALYIGTSAIISINTQRTDAATSAAALLTSANGSRNMFMSTSEMAGGCIEWLINTFYSGEREKIGNDIYSMVDNDVSSVKPGADKLFFNPWLYGERNPLDDEFIRGAFINLNSTHERKHLARAVYEGIAYNMHWMLMAIDQTYGISFSRVSVAGGASRSKELVKILPCVFNKPVDVLEDAHMSVAKGTGLLALIGIGILKDFDCAKELVHVQESYYPDPELVGLYNKGQKHYMQLYSLLRKFCREING
jgi:Sugar (pentulose and hexulose) kinases